MRKRIWYSGLALALAISLAAARVSAQPADADSTSRKIAEIKDQLTGITETISTLNTDVGILKKLKVSGYIQARYERHFDSISHSDSSGTTLNRDDFYIRRGRVKFTYTPSTSSQYVLYFDASRASVSLKEAYAKLIEPWTGLGASLTFGQQNVPFGYEIERSSSVRELPERSRAENNLFPGERDRGLKLIVPVDPRVTITAGVWNGQGINNKVAGVDFAGKDNDIKKDASLRGVVSLGYLDLGASLYSGTLQVPTKSGSAKTLAPRQFTKNRYGADAQTYFELPRLGGASLKGEVYLARDVVLPKNKPPRQANPLGWYAMAVQNLGEKLQVAGRVDRFDPNRDAAGDATTTWSGAFNYSWDGNTRLTLAYDHPVNQVSSGSTDPKDDFVTVQFQLVF